LKCWSSPRSAPWGYDIMLYLDYAASSPIRPSALEVLKKSLAEDFANPLSFHKLGKDLHRKIEGCRRKFLEFLGGDVNDRWIFTSSATESNNTFIEGIGLEEGDTVLVSMADHPSVTVPAENLKTRNIPVKPIPLNSRGTIDKPGLLSLVDPSVKLVILTHVNNQCGSLIDGENLCREIKQKGDNLYIFVDAAQGFGKIPFSLKNWEVDGISISSHKIGGPKGIAGLYVKAGTPFSPLLYGGGQEDGLRASTPAAPLIFSFFEAAQEALDSIEASLSHVARLNRLTRQLLKEKIDDIEFPFPVESTSPYILMVILPGISSDIILRHLEQEDIFVSTSSACSSRVKGSHPVFTALHVPEKYHKFILRISFSHEIGEADIEIFARTLAEIYNDLARFLK